MPLNKLEASKIIVEKNSLIIYDDKFNVNKIYPIQNVSLIQNVNLKIPLNLIQKIFFSIFAILLLTLLTFIFVAITMPEYSGPYYSNIYARTSALGLGSTLSIITGIIFFFALFFIPIRPVSGIIIQSNSSGLEYIPIKNTDYKREVLEKMVELVNNNFDTETKTIFYINNSSIESYDLKINQSMNNANNSNSNVDNSVNNSVVGNANQAIIGDNNNQNSNPIVNNNILNFVDQIEAVNKLIEYANSINSTTEQANLEIELEQLTKAKDYLDAKDAEKAKAELSKLNHILNREDVKLLTTIGGSLVVEVIKKFLGF
jgi:hypothetical protein